MRPTILNFKLGFVTGLSYNIIQDYALSTFYTNVMLYTSLYSLIKETIFARLVLCLIQISHLRTDLQLITVR